MRLSVPRTTRATARQAEQRSWECRAWCNQVHSVVTQEVKSIEAEKLSAHAVRVAFASGQLLFLGLYPSGQLGGHADIAAGCHRQQAGFFCLGNVK